MTPRKAFKIALISLGSGSSKMTLEALQNHFAEVEDINIKQIEVNVSGKDAEVLYQGVPIGRYDCIYAKGSFRYAPLLSSLTTLLQERSYMPIRDSAFTVAHDKLLTHLALQRQNIPMPRTYIAATSEAAKLIMKRMNFPIIMKFPQGTQGKGVVFADSFSSGSSILDALTALRQPFILQEYVETGGEDIRALVVGDRVVASMKRLSNSDEKRSNLHAGGSAEPVHLDGATEKIAVAAARAINAEICGVDILQTAKGPVVIEVNISPGLQGITEATGIDIPGKIARHLFARTREWYENTKGRFEHSIMRSIDENNQSLMTSLDFRGNRVLLPELITKKCGFKEHETYEFKSKKGKLEIKKMNIG